MYTQKNKKKKKGKYFFYITLPYINPTLKHIGCGIYAYESHMCRSHIYESHTQCRDEARSSYGQGPMAEKKNLVGAK